MVPFVSVEDCWYSSCDEKPGSASEINTGVLQFMDCVAPIGLRLFFVRYTRIYLAIRWSFPLTKKTTNN